MAKGIEDTAFYRWHRQVGLNEVGGDPDLLDERLPRAAARAGRSHQQQHWPLGMTTLSTHDTKRSEDVRARLLAVAGDAESWQRCSEEFAAAAAASAASTRPTAHLVWQTLAGVGDDRRRAAQGLPRQGDARVQAAHLLARLRPGVRGPRARPGRRRQRRRPARARWSAPPSTTTRRRSGPLVLGAEAAPADPARRARTPTRAASSSTSRWSTPTTAARSTTTSAAPGSRTLRDGRRPATSTTRSCWSPTRRSRCAASCATRFGDPGDYQPLVGTSRHLVGFVRGGEVAVLATRAAKRLEVVGGWDGATFALPEGLWRDELTGALHGGAENSCADVLARLPGGAAATGAPRDDARAIWAPRAGARRPGRSATAGTRCAADDDGWWRGDADARRRRPLRLLPRRRRPAPRPARAAAPRRPARPVARCSTSARTPGPTATGAASPLEGAVIYETHVGTFTPEGTLDAAVERLPTSSTSASTWSSCCRWRPFPGAHNWGYDGDRAVLRARGVRRPRGAAAVRRRRARATASRSASTWSTTTSARTGTTSARSGPTSPTTTHTPWGQALNLDGRRQRRGTPLGARQRAAVAARLPRRRAAARRGARAARRHAPLHAARGDVARGRRARRADRPARCGWSPSPTATTPARSPRAGRATRSAGSGCTRQWADDVHHALHVALTGETQGYYADFADPERAGQGAAHAVLPRRHATPRSAAARHGRPVDAGDRARAGGSSASLQTHDQVGNRAQGDRLSGRSSTSTPACWPAGRRSC